MMQITETNSQSAAILILQITRGVLLQMRVRENQTQALRVTEGCTENKVLERATDHEPLQRLYFTWDVANRWISQNAAMSLLIAATLGATWGWIQKRSP